MATKITVEGAESRHTDMSLEGLQAAVGGWIQVVPTNDGREMVLDEEGKLKENLVVNEKATALTRGVVADDDLIVGDVVVCDKGEIK